MLYDLHHAISATTVCHILHCKCGSSDSDLYKWHSEFNIKLLNAEYVGQHEELRKVVTEKVCGEGCPQ